MKKIRFLHAADLHLDSPFKGLKNLPAARFKNIQGSTFASFERLIDEALKREVDFVLISGDLFDEEDRSIRAQARLVQQFDRLEGKGIPVFIIHGNHDHLGGFRVQLDMPPHVHIFSDKPEWKHLRTKEGADVSIAGFSYGSRHIHERMIPITQRQRATGIRIALLHGSEGSIEADHEPYAPFTIKELVGKGYHYWALGHIHKRQILHKDPYIVYPGNIQGRHRKETGPKGCYEVEMEGDRTELTFIPVQEVEWVQKSVSLDGVTRFGELYNRIREAVDSCGEAMIELRLEGKGSLGEEEWRRIQNGEVLDTIQSAMEDEQGIKWVHRVSFEEEKLILEEHDPFSKVMFKMLDELEQGTGHHPFQS
ncbi:metallophosphoesterase family protein [Rossellomorea sp. H39__3]